VYGALLEAFLKLTFFGQGVAHQLPKRDELCVAVLGKRDSAVAGRRVHRFDLGGVVEYVWPREAARGRGRVFSWCKAGFRDGGKKERPARRGGLYKALAYGSPSSDVSWYGA